MAVVLFLALSACHVSQQVAFVQTIKEQIPSIAEAGFTAMWLPPPSDAVSSQGYLPRDYYNLNSKYGTEAELRELLAVMHENGVKAIADIVINHRCAHFQVCASHKPVLSPFALVAASIPCDQTPAHRYMLSLTHTVDL